MGKRKRPEFYQVFSYQKNKVKKVKIKKYSEKKGFTIIEVLVAVAVLSAISALVLAFLVQGSGLYHFLTKQSYLRSVSRGAMEYMRRELKMATYDPSSSSQSPSLHIPQMNRQLHFYLPEIDEGGEVKIDGEGDIIWDENNKIKYQYIPGLNQLRRQEKGEELIVAGADEDVRVTSVEFQNHQINNSLYADQVKITLTLEKNTPRGRPVSVTLTSIIKLRN